MEKTVKITGVRFNCVSGEPKPVEQELTLKESATVPGEMWIHVSPGVTGYEGIRLEKVPERVNSGGWWACAGTTGRYDGLYFHALQLKKAFKEFD